MLGICISFLVIVGCICLHLLRTSPKRPLSFDTSPSDALIDSVLPAEIMEHIISSVDARGSYACRLVSKYWFGFATRHSIKKTILENMLKKMTISEGITSEELEYGPAAWEDYEMSYPLDQRLHDFAVAQKHGKDLLELKSYTLSGLRRIHTCAENKYIIKSTAQKLGMPGTFTTNTSSALEFYCSLRFAARSDEWREDRHAKCEIMFDLSEYFNVPAYQIKPILLRPMNRTRYFSAVPLTSDLFGVLFYLLAPVLLHDLVNVPIVSAIFHELVPWAVLFMLFVVNIFFSRVFTAEDIQSHIGGYVVIAALSVGTIVAHPYSLQCFEFLGQVVMLFTYMSVFGSYVLPNGLVNAILYDGICRKKAQICFAVVIITVLTIDWRGILLSIRDGSLLYLMLLNFAYLCVPIVNIIIVEIINKSMSGRKVEWVSAIPWPERGFTELKIIAAAFFATIIQCQWRTNM